MIHVGLYLLLGVALFAIIVFSLRLDLRLHPWLAKAEFRWYYIFTTRHALTIWFGRKSEQEPLIAYIVITMYSAVLALLFYLAWFR
ncbi:MAG: hypothetical protein AAB490_05440 [Patescibacteria group bacterium]